jgi:hypothetical protein
LVPRSDSSAPFLSRDLDLSLLPMLLFWLITILWHFQYCHSQWRWWSLLGGSLMIRR